MKKALILGVFILMITSLLPSIAFANAYEYDHIIKEASEKYGVPFTTIKAVIAKESSFRANAVPKNSNGELITSARGLMQMTKGACQDAGFNHDDMFDPYKNIMAGTKYLKMQMDYLDSYTDGIKAYYAGAGNILRNKLTAEANAYFQGVMAYKVAFMTDLRGYL